MTVKALTATQHERALEQARAKHDARYSVDHPAPALERFNGELTLLERLVQHLWAVWAVLGLAGALISLPHTLQTVMATVALRPGLKAGYAAAVFVGVELALIATALAAELKRQEAGAAPRKVASLAGLLNGLAVRVGMRPPVNTSHLPARREASGAGLIAGLFVAALTFNLADTLSDVSLLAPYTAEIHLAARIMAGALGPGLLLIAGHRFAHEVVKAAAGRKSSEQAYRDALQAWQDGLQASWRASGEEWVSRALAAAWRARNPGAPDEHNPYLPEEAPAGVPFGTNGHRVPASS